MKVQPQVEPKSSGIQEDRQGLHGSPATREKGAAAPQKGAGETSKYSLPFVKKINIGFRGNIRTVRDYIH